MPRARQSVAHLDVEKLTSHPDNVRQDLGDLTDLARSIREQGVLEPIIVTEHPDGAYLVLDGHRRLGAAKLIDFTRIPAIVRHHVADPAEQTITMLATDVHKRSFTPLERAQAFAKLHNLGLNMSQIARRVGVTPSTVSNTMALLDVDESTQRAIAAGTITIGDARRAVREHRAQTRAAEARPTRGRPVQAEPRHLGYDHPLFIDAAAACDHTTAPQAGAGVCGRCWEAAIRADALGQPAPAPAYDELLVERYVKHMPAGEHVAQADRIEIVRRIVASGGSLEDLARRTSWKVALYFRADPQHPAQGSGAA